MTTAADVLAVAASKIGVDDHGTNTNEFTAWYGINGPWCAMFVSWCFFTAGLPLPASSPKGFAYCPAGQAWFKAQNRWHDGIDGIATGDVVFWEMGTAPGTDHVEIVESMGTDGRLTTLGGNVGDRVGRFTRQTGNVVGYGRPDYAGGSGLHDVSIGGNIPGIGGGQLDVPNPLDALGSVRDALGAIGSFLMTISSPDTVRRAGYVAAGVGLLALGAMIIHKDAIVGLGKTAAGLGAAVATDGASLAVTAPKSVAKVTKAASKAKGVIGK